MNLILLFQNDFIQPNTVCLTGRRLTHLKKVHRAKPGDTLTVGLLDGLMGKGIVTHMGNDRVELEVSLDTPPPAPLPLTLLLALPRPKMLKRILQTIAALGVKEIFLINTWRVEKCFWSSNFLEKKRVEEELILGLEQAKDTLMPQVHLKRLFMPFVTEELPEMIKALMDCGDTPPNLLTAHPGGSLPCPQNINTPTILAMGPEGGFIDAEVSALEKRGFQTVHLGERILRLETAVPFVVSKLF